MLQKFPNLKQFVVHDVGNISVADWNKTPASTRLYLQSMLSLCCWTGTGVQTGLERLARGQCPRELDLGRLHGAVKATAILYGATYEDPESEANRPFSQQIRMGLQGIEIDILVCLEPELGHLCRELEFS